MTVFLKSKRGLEVMLALSIALVVLCFTARLGAQVTGGTILGTVTDTTGAAVPNVQVSITNTSTNVVTNLNTNDAGLYSAPNLAARALTKLLVKATGFSLLPSSTELT